SGSRRGRTDCRRGLQSTRNEYTVVRHPPGKRCYGGTNNRCIHRQTSLRETTECAFPRSWDTEWPMTPHVCPPVRSVPLHRERCSRCRRLERGLYAKLVRPSGESAPIVECRGLVHR